MNMDSTDSKFLQRIADGLAAIDPRGDRLREIANRIMQLEGLLREARPGVLDGTPMFGNLHWVQRLDALMTQASGEAKS
jgi:hypothetical protein